MKTTTRLRKRITGTVTGQFRWKDWLNYPLRCSLPKRKVMDQYDQEERARLCRLLAEGLDACLTAPQRRRLWLYCVEGLTIKEIAAQEKVKHQNISKRILAAKKILKKFLERWVQNGTKNGGK